MGPVARYPDGVALTCGVLAQMVERSLRMREVRGSMPLYSTGRRRQPARNVGLVVEYNPATVETRVRFPDVAEFPELSFCLLFYLCVFCFHSVCLSVFCFFLLDPTFSYIFDLLLLLPDFLFSVLCSLSPAGSESAVKGADS